MTQKESNIDKARLCYLSHHDTGPFSSFGMFLSRAERSRFFLRQWSEAKNGTECEDKSGIKIYLKASFGKWIIVRGMIFSFKLSLNSAQNMETYSIGTMKK